MSNITPATMSVEEASIYLGIGKSKIYQMINNGQIPHVKFGKIIRIPIHLLDEWIIQRCS